MRNKTIAFYALFCSVFFEFGCYSVKMTKPEQIIGKDVDIRRVIKNSGEILEFPREAPATVVDGKIVTPNSVVIHISEVNQIWIKKFDPFKTALLVLGVVGAYYLVSYILLNIVLRQFVSEVGR